MLPYLPIMNFGFDQKSQQQFFVLNQIFKQNLFIMNSISRNSTAMLILSGICILSAIFLPIWNIYLDAPQYPEGLGLSIYANKLGGDVDIINGLNHYIGMKTLHAEEFIEFTVLPYIIGFFGILAIITGLFLKTKKSVIILLVSFLLFGILAMYDFWRWEYNYGHNLDPNAAIIVPGMAYQPPLIGFKQLLNFGAYSIPAIGGWLMLIMYLMLVLVGAGGGGNVKILRGAKGKVASMVFFCVFLTNCSPEGPDPIILNKDICSFCKMNISDGHFGAEIITEKGRIFKFDDISCMMAYKSQHQDSKIKNHYVHHYTGDNELIPAENAYYIQGGTLKSPMAGNVAAFNSETEASQQAANLNAQSTDWNHLTQVFAK